MHILLFQPDDRDILKYCTLIFTKAETELNDYPLEAFLNRMKENENFKDFVNKINHRVIAVNNSTNIPAEQERNRKEIIAMVDELVEHNRQQGRSGIYKYKLHKKVEKGLHLIMVLIAIFIVMTGFQPDSVLRNIYKTLNFHRETNIFNMSRIRSFFRI